ncbi:toll-like receptor 7 [Leptodactylus fuscus]|uniref:toll-like receptor 7 n=1 Tax=Leptodactylus fuscus TaxID=238119 RepID=UPI003F4E856F
MEEYEDLGQGHYGGATGTPKLEEEVDVDSPLDAEGAFICHTQQREESDPYFFQDDYNDDNKWVFLFSSTLLFLKLLMASRIYKNLPCSVIKRESIIIVDCTQGRLDTIPPGIPTNTTNLILNINKIREITPDSFGELRELTEISLKCNCIPVYLGSKDDICTERLRILNGSFSNLNKLQSLYLDANQIVQIPRGLPPNLVLLSLQVNNIFSISKENFTEIPHIQNLYLGMNCYYKNPCNVTFNIENDAFKDLKNLTLLNLKSNNISFVPKGLPSSLKELYLYNNRIELIHEHDFQNLTKLEILDLGGNCPHCINSPFPCSSCPNSAPIAIPESAFDSLTNLKVLRLNSNSLRTVSHRWFTHIRNLQVLDLSQNFLAHEIKEATFLPYVPTLTNLDLSYNYDPGVYNTDLNLSHLFSTLKSLEVLRIRGYIFQELKKSNLMPLVDLVNLTILDLGTNFIKVADFSLFKKFKSLNSIRLSNNKIYSSGNSIPESCSVSQGSPAQYGYTRFQDVHYFNYDEQGLTCKPKMNEDSEFQEFVDESCESYGQMLDLSQNNFFFIQPSDFKDLSFIKCLNLSGNAVSQALNGTEFIYLKHLKYLDFSNNRIDLYYSTIFEELEELEILDLSFNKHYFLTEGLTHMLNFTGNLGKLKKLMMNWNEISTSTNRHMVSESLHILEFKGNRLDILWQDGDDRYYNFFQKLTKLCKLDISFNSLTFIPAEVFEGMPPNLTELYLSNNNLKFFNWEQLIILRNLELLDLSNNYLTSLPHLFNCTHSIKKLILNHNRIIEIDYLILFNAYNLKYLDLSFNLINQTNILPEDVLNKLDILLFHGNPFICDCHNKWFVSWIHETNIIIPYLASDVLCVGPGKYEGKSLVEFDYKTCVSIWEDYVFLLLTFVVASVLVGSLATHFLYWDVWYVYHLAKARYKGFMRLPRNCYDAFIVYDAKDEAVSDWVLHELVKVLEGRENRRFRLCLSERDWEAGIPVFENLENSIQQSQKTVFLLTKKSIRAGFLKTALFMAHQRLIQEKVDVIIMIYLEQIFAKPSFFRMREKLCGRTVLYWPTNPKVQSYFWHCLITALRSDNVNAYQEIFRNDF